MAKIMAFLKHIKNGLLRFVKGLCIGVAAIIPGISGGTLAVILNCFDEIIEAISNLFHSFKKNIMILVPLGLGALVGILSLVVPLQWAFEYALFPTVTLFAGFIIGGLEPIYKKTEGKKSIGGYIAFIISLAFVIGVAFIPQSGREVFESLKWFDYLILIGVGVIGAAALVIPGISGSMLLLILGFWKPILNSVKELMTFVNLPTNLLVLAMFAVGVVIGFFIISKIMNYALKKYSKETYMGILAFIVGSLFTLYYTQVSGFKFDVWQIVSAVILGILGFAVSFSINYYVKHKKVIESAPLVIEKEASETVVETKNDIVADKNNKEDKE